MDTVMGAVVYMGMLICILHYSNLAGHGLLFVTIDLSQCSCFSSFCHPANTDGVMVAAEAVLIAEALVSLAGTLCMHALDFGCCNWQSRYLIHY